MTYTRLLLRVGNGTRKSSSGMDKLGSVIDRVNMGLEASFLPKHYSTYHCVCSQVAMLNEQLQALGPPAPPAKKSRSSMGHMAMQVIQYKLPSLLLRPSIFSCMRIASCSCY